METKRCTKCSDIKLVEAFPKDHRLESGLSSQCRSCHAIRSRRAYENKKTERREKSLQWHRQNPDYQKNYYETNREKISAAAAAYYQKNRSKILARYERISDAEWVLRKAASKERARPGARLRKKLHDERRRAAKAAEELAADIRRIQSEGVRKKKSHHKICPILRFDENLYQEAKRSLRLKRAARIPADKKREATKDWKRRNPAKVSAQHYRRRAIMAELPTTDLTNQEWEFIKRMYAYRCAYCREVKPLTQDHVIPVSKGGLHTASNIVPACQSCNSRKGNRLVGPPPPPAGGNVTDQLVRNAERLTRVLMRVD